MWGHECSSPAPAQRPLHTQVSPPKQTWTLGVALARAGLGVLPPSQTPCKQAGKKERDHLSTRPTTPRPHPTNKEGWGGLGDLSPTEGRKEDHLSLKSYHTFAFQSITYPKPSLPSKCPIRALDSPSMPWRRREITPHQIRRAPWLLLAVEPRRRSATTQCFSSLLSAPKLHDPVFLCFEMKFFSSLCTDHRTMQSSLSCHSFRNVRTRGPTFEGPRTISQCAAQGTGILVPMLEGKQREGTGVGGFAALTREERESELQDRVRDPRVLEKQRSVVNRVHNGAATFSYRVKRNPPCPTRAKTGLTRRWLARGGGRGSCPRGPGSPLCLGGEGRGSVVRVRIRKRERVRERRISGPSRV